MGENTQFNQQPASNDFILNRTDFGTCRRAFVQALGLGAMGAAIFGASGPEAALAQGAPADITDIDIVQFALNFEYLGAEYYLRAVNGTGLQAGDIDGVGGIGTVSGGHQVPFADNFIRKFAFELAADEEAHVRTLRAALPAASRIGRPQLDVGFAFTFAARAAGLVGPNDPFDIYANENNFLLGAFLLEDVCVTALIGGAPFIQDKGVLMTAAGFLGTEGYQAGAIRSLLFSRGLIAPANAISNARDALDANTDLDQGISGDQSATPGFSQTDANLVPTNAQGLAFGRTFGQVLNIAYLNTTQSPGGFFPQGLRGRLR